MFRVVGSPGQVDDPGSWDRWRRRIARFARVSPSAVVVELSNDQTPDEGDEGEGAIGKPETEDEGDGDDGKALTRVTTTITFDDSEQGKRKATRAAERLCWLFSRTWSTRLLERLTGREIEGETVVRGPPIPEEDFVDQMLRLPQPKARTSSTRPPASMPEESAELEAYNASLFDHLELYSNPLLNFTELSSLLVEPPFELSTVEIEIIIFSETKLVEVPGPNSVGVHYLLVTIAAVLCLLLTAVVALLTRRRTRQSKGPAVTARAAVQMSDGVQVQVAPAALAPHPSCPEVEAVNTKDYDQSDHGDGRV